MLFTASMLLAGALLVNLITDVAYAVVRRIDR